MIALIALLLAQAVQQDGIRVQQGGTTKGTASTLNCSTGTTCTVSGGKATITASGASGYVTVQQSGAALAAETTLNFAGAGVSCVDNAGATRTDCTIAGGGAAGGSNTQVQYNNSTAFGGMARVTTDGNDLKLSTQTTMPTAPAAGLATVLGYSRFGPALPMWLSGDLGFGFGRFPQAADASSAWWGCLQVGFGQGTYQNTGVTTLAQATGTTGSVSWASTDARTRIPWGSFTSSATASSSAGQRAGTATCWRGNAAGLGGFWIHGQTAVMGTPPANQRLFFGLAPIGVLNAAADPSATTNQVGFQCDAGQTTLRVGSNDNVGTATVSDLGVNFPCTTTSTAWDWWLWAVPNGSQINYAIRDMVSGNTASGFLNTDLPQNTVQLTWQDWINNGGTSASATIHVGAHCWVANP